MRKKLTTAAVLCGALITASAGSASATTGIPKAAGFHLSGEGNVVPLAVDGQHVRAADGTEHIFALGSDGLVYETRAAGAASWTSVPIAMPDPSPQHETPGATLEVSADGTTVHAFVTTCSGTYVFEAPVDSTTLGTAVLVPGSATTLCSIQIPPLVTEVPTTGDNDLFLFSDGTTAIGPPDGPLTPGDTIPNVGDRQFVGITRDAVTGELAVLAGLPDRADHSPMSVWTKPASGPWSKRTVVAHINALGHGFVTGAITSYGGQILVGLDENGHGRGLPASGVTIVTRSPKGKWSAATRLPHSNHSDLRLTLNADPASGRIVATYVQYSLGGEHGKRDGLLMEQRINGRWHQPTHLVRLKKQRYALTTTSVSFDEGKPTVGFVYDD